MNDIAKASAAAANYGQSEDCDVLLFSGDLVEPAYQRLRSDILSRNRRKSALVVLVTWGGDAHVSYKMGRCLQRMYEEVRIFVVGPCKSAGTLLAIAGHELIVSNDGELGPIDVQQMRPDELWERTSGLIESAAMDSLGQISWDLLERLIAEIKEMSLGRITFKTAADAAAPIVSGVLSPIFAQIDPLKVGETARALQIASKYAEILNRVSKNLKLEAMAIDKLATGYPDHGFIIDREESETLFHRVREPVDLLQALADGLGQLNPGRAAIIFLNDEKPVEEPNMETQDGTEIKGNGAEPADSHTTPANGDSPFAEEVQAADREVGAADSAD